MKRRVAKEKKKKTLAEMTERERCVEILTWKELCPRCARACPKLVSDCCETCDAELMRERWLRSLEIQGRHPFRYDVAAQDGFCECGKSREGHEA